MGSAKNRSEKKQAQKEFHFLPFKELSKIKEGEPSSIPKKESAIPKKESTPKVSTPKLQESEVGGGMSAADVPSAADGTSVFSDDHLLSLAMSGVKPLVGPAQAPKIPRARPMLAEANDDLLVMRELDELVNGEGSFDFADTEEFIEACRADLDRRILKRLRKGEFSFQAHIDLHGMNRQEARAAVGEFIKQSFIASKKCVLIVHGRGLGSKDNIPIIKNKLAAWLTRGSIGKKVLAYTSAIPSDGGTGAVYVLLASS